MQQVPKVCVFFVITKCNRISTDTEKVEILHNESLKVNFKHFVDSPAILCRPLHHGGYYVLSYTMALLFNSPHDKSSLLILPDFQVAKIGIIPSLPLKRNRKSRAEYAITAIT